MFTSNQIKISRIVLLVLLATPIVCISTIAESKSSGKQRKLNNLVTELVREALPESGLAEYTFKNPKDGWIFIKAPAEMAASGRVIVSFDRMSRKQAIISRKTGRHGEAMRWFHAGVYKIYVWTKDKPEGMLIVRSIPEIIFLQFTGDFNSPDGSPYKVSQKEVHGSDRLYLYYWDYLDKYVLDNVNVVQADESCDERPEIKKWLAEGRKLISGAHFPSLNPDDLYRHWSKSMRVSNFSGVLVDEFVSPTNNISFKDRLLGGYNPGFGFRPEILNVIRRIHDSGQKGKFYAYLGVPKAASVKDSRPLLDILEASGYYWVWEAYLWEQSNLDEAKSYMEKELIQRMREFRKEFPGYEKHLILCPSIMGPWDSIPYMDYKVWLDMQMNASVSNPAFEGIYGIAPYQSTTADPEMIRWVSALLRHYFIEGNTGLLSAKYGYSLLTDHLRNADFSAEAAAWNVHPAKAGSIQFKKVRDLPFKKGYLPLGPGILVMKRESQKANVVRQEIRNLKPGRLYSFRMFIGDLSATDLKTRQIYAHSVAIKGAVILPQEGRQDVQRGDAAIKNSICWNYTYIVFKAVKPSAMLEISDWIDAKIPGGPVHQELLFDFMQIQPFYSAEET